jgi:hypothetical protein
MKEVSKRSAVQCLEIDWAGYPARYGLLSPKEKEDYLQRQGFARVSDLLAHINAWWGEAAANIRGVQENPDFKSRKYDVDQFNAEAILKSSGKTEPEILREFEDTRRTLLDLVSALSEAQIGNSETQQQLFWMVTNHYAEHQF